MDKCALDNISKAKEMGNNVLYHIIVKIMEFLKMVTLLIGIEKNKLSNNLKILIKMESLYI
jgi:hypothetical protein